MAITKDLFKNAFREAIASEYNGIPSNDVYIDYSFSDRFEIKMQKLIKSQKTSYWRFINTSAKKVAVIFLACVILFSSAMGVKAIREPIVKFFKEIHDTFVSYYFEGDTIDELPANSSTDNSIDSSTDNSIDSSIDDSADSSIEVSDETTSGLQLPNGFVQVDVLEDENMISTIYANDSGDIIEYTKMITNDTRLTFDTEHMTSKTIYINTTKVDIYQGDGIMHAVWIEDRMLMLITCSGNIEPSDLEIMIASSIEE